MSDPLSPRLLARAHPVALKLLNQQYPPPPPSPAADDSARFDALCILLSSSVIHTWEFKSSHVALETVSCAALPALLDALRGGSIRFLQILVPHLCELLSGTATSGGTGEGTWTGETVEMMRRAANALEAVVRNAKPRMARWEGRIGAAIGMCWIAARESEGARRLGEADGREALQHLKEALRSVARALDEALSTSVRFHIARLCAASLTARLFPHSSRTNGLARETRLWKGSFRLALFRNEQLDMHKQSLQ